MKTEKVPKLEYALCDFDTYTGTVLDNNGSLEWKTGTMGIAQGWVRKHPGACALFFPGDVPGIGHPPYPDVSRKDFKKEPGKYGVCFYKASSGYAFE